MGKEEFYEYWKGIFCFDCNVEFKCVFISGGRVDLFLCVVFKYNFSFAVEIRMVFGVGFY